MMGAGLESASFLRLLGIDWPIIQAPMAGTSTSLMAAAVSNAGGLGSIGVGAMTAANAVESIAAFRERSHRALNVNVFCHHPAKPDPSRDTAWLSRLRPEFENVGAEPPASILEIYKSFVEDEEMLAVLIAAKPKVVSFHFGVPPDASIRALREAGILLLGTATNLAEAETLVDSGVHAVIAQGYEAGGHRGIFDPEGKDDQLGTLPLTRTLVKSLRVPVIAAGGIMDGAGIGSMLRLGAAAAQLGTAFVATDESAADEGYRRTLFSAAANHTIMTRVISGRPARCLSNRFTRFGATLQSAEIPPYPIAYSAGKALHEAARAVGVQGYGAHWAGQGAPLARTTSTEKLMKSLIRELAWA